MKAFSFSAPRIPVIKSGASNYLTIPEWLVLSGGKADQENDSHYQTFSPPDSYLAMRTIFTHCCTMSRLHAGTV
jgi:hypothetical protein